MKGFFLILLFNCLFFESMAQYIYDWQRSYGGDGQDRANKIIEVSDGGLMIAGKTSTSSEGSYDAWIIKLDSQGKIEWERIIGGDKDDGANSLIETNYGYIVAGYTASKGKGSYSFWIFKLDRKGNIQWEKVYGGAKWDIAYDITQSANNEYMVVGCTESAGNGAFDAWVMKLNRSGNKIWDKTYGGRRFDKAHCVITTSDNAYLIAGYTASKGSGERDGWIVKIKEDGTKQWDAVAGGRHRENFRSLIETSKNTYIAVGYTKSFGHGQSDIYIVNFSNSGKKQWEKYYGGTKNDVAYNVLKTPDGFLTLTGYTESEGNGAKDCFVMQVDNYGNAFRSQTYGEANDEMALTATQVRDQGIVIAGLTNTTGLIGNDVYVAKLKYDAAEHSLPEIVWLSPTVFTKPEAIVKARITSNVKVSVNQGNMSSVLTNAGEQTENDNIYEFRVKLKEGSNTIRLTASNSSGVVSKDFQVTYVSEHAKPEIIWIYPEHNITTDAQTVYVEAKVISASRPVVIVSKGKHREDIRAKPKKVEEQNVFYYKFLVKLLQGRNIITIKASNSAGTNIKSKAIIRENR